MSDMLIVRTTALAYDFVAGKPLAWVAEYGGFEVEDDCPLTAAARVMELVMEDHQ